MIVSLVVFAMVFSVIIMPVSASAAENSVPNNFHIPDYIYTEDDVVVDKPIGLVINDRPEDPLSMSSELSTTRATTSVIYGPYTTIMLDDSKMQVIFSTLKSGFNTVSVIYNGVNCFKFESGNTIIYIARSTMLQPLNSLCTAINSTLTSKANNRDTSLTYTNIYRSYLTYFGGYPIYRTSIARVGVQMYYNSSNQIYMNVKVIDSIAVNIYDAFIDDWLYPCEASFRPTAIVNITNTGTSNSMYFGGYEIQGVGDNTSTTSIGSLVSLGYKSVQTIGSILNPTISTIFGLYNDLVGLANSDGGSRHFYYTMPISLSNPSTSKYSYNCTTPSPFTLRLTNDYLTLKIGTIGTQVSTTMYDIRCNINFN